jgi:L-seryl-tRNA(Ser) seleniumtransferase
MAESRDSLRGLPAIGRLLDSGPIGALARVAGGALVGSLVREEVERLRQDLLAGRLVEADLAHRGSAEEIARRVARQIDRLLAPSPRTVINATGVVVHTNLGRSVLSEHAARRVAEVSSRYMDLEFDLETGGRGSRGTHLAPLLARLFPGSGGFAVNNNAAAVFLALRVLARGKEVVVSRGELVEIGGSFRVPDILAASGARLVEVGTTNRTRASDYEGAIGPRTALLLKVHTSNFKIVGFTEEVSVAELSAVAKRGGVPLLVDWGSGDLVDLAPAGVGDEIPVSKILGDGADLVTFSGDKLLGGPQAGVLVGREDLVARLRRDPLARVVRLDRLLTAALRETLVAYVRGRAFEEVPTLRMIALAAAEIGGRAESVRASLVARGVEPSRLAIVDGVSRTGGGSSPVGEIPTRLLAVGGADRDLARIERRLREGVPPIVARVREGRLLLDFRTVFPDQDAEVLKRLGEELARR